MVTAISSVKQAVEKTGSLSTFQPQITSLQPNFKANHAISYNNDNVLYGNKGRAKQTTGVRESGVLIVGGLFECSGADRRPNQTDYQTYDELHFFL